MQIQDRVIGGDVPFVIAEAGVNHDGDVAAAHRLIDIAAGAGADAVKFQTFAPTSLVSSGAGTTPYQQRAGGVQTQAEMLAALTLPRDAWIALSRHARDSGLIFLSTPFDLDSAELLAELGVPALKTGSGELTNLPFLRALAAFGLPLLISTGMANWDEVDSAVAAASGADIALFHCVSAYPAPLEECNLRVVPAMRERFGVPVGWSDHTLGLTTAVAAAALGARLFEKHFTFDSSAPGPDHAASLEPDQLRAYVSTVHDAVAALGDGVKRRVASEEENAPLVRRSWHARRDLPAGTVLEEADIVDLRPETGISVAVDVTGCPLSRFVAAGRPIGPDDLGPRSGRAA
ncbi:MAG TPA: N-acetylneuraminate synthase family protein [Blastococcus sp.]|nr:N-acetylneuraminate synthase family protein [Blastococcus sp.]